MLAGRQNAARTLRKSSLQGQAQSAAQGPGLPQPQPRRARLRQCPRPRPPRASRAHPGWGMAQSAQPGPPAPSARPAARQVQLWWPVASGGRRLGPGAPDGTASSPRALTCAAHSTGVAGRPGREVAAAPAAGREGVRPGAFPRSHFPPSRESPRARPRARQCARAALPSTAGGGGAAGGGRAGAQEGARRRPRGPPAAVPPGRSCAPLSPP